MSQLIIGYLRSVMAAMESKAKKCNFSETEIKVLVSEEEERKGILFGGPSSGITNKKKCVEWHCRSKCNWFGQQDSSQNKEVVRCQKRIACHRQSVSETGQGVPSLSPPETRMASIIGDTSIVSKRGDNHFTACFWSFSSACVRSDRMARMEVVEC